MDSYLLLSIINTNLRDFYQDLDSFIEDLNIDKRDLFKKLSEINYFYNAEYNQFIYLGKENN